MPGSTRGRRGDPAVYLPEGQIRGKLGPDGDARPVAAEARSQQPARVRRAQCEHCFDRQSTFAVVLDLAAGTITAGGKKTCLPRRRPLVGYIAELEAPASKQLTRVEAENRSKVLDVLRQARDLADGQGDLTALRERVPRDLVFEPESLQLLHRIVDRGLADSPEDAYALMELVQAAALGSCDLVFR